MMMMMMMILEFEDELWYLFIYGQEIKVLLIFAT